MKVSLSLENNKNNNQINFTGFKWGKDEYGFRQFEFNYPFDPSKQECYLEVFNLGQSDVGNYYTTSRAKNRRGETRIPMSDGVNRLNMTQEFGILPDSPFAYHYVVKDKNKDGETIEIDAGDSIQEDKYGQKMTFNIVVPGGSFVSKGGSMRLVNVDTQNVGVVYDEHGKWTINEQLKNRAQKSVKTLTNVYGGTVAGLEKDIDEGKYDGYSRIISLPIFTRDDFSSHKYWIENIFQPCNSLLNINNYGSLQRKMFAHDLNFVSDGAFVNEGLQGTHFTNVLKWGTESPYFRWFRASNLKDAPLSLGVFPKNTQNVTFKLVNSPVLYEQNSSGKVIEHSNKHYDPKRPTYMQFLDKRLVTAEELNDPELLIKTYSKLNTENFYDIHTHDDSVFPYAFEVDPETVKDNVKCFNQHNSSLPKEEKLRFDSYEAARIMSKNENYVVDGKFESGFETWDANPDIAKLNFVISNNDLKSLKNMTPEDAAAEEAKIRIANWQVQDYTVEGGKYWTRKTADILRMHIAQNIAKADVNNPSQVYQNIMDKSDGVTFPTSLKAELCKDEVENVLDGYYSSSRRLSKEDKNGQILEQLMNMPLESIEFGTNLVGVLGSPLVSKRASTEEEIGVPRYDLYKLGNPNLPKEYLKSYNEMENIYKNQMLNFASDVLNEVDAKLSDDNKLFDGEKVTEFGRYVLPLIVPAIAKYSIVQALAPDVDTKFDKTTGEISYDYNKLLNTHVESLNLPKAGSAQDEAMLVLNKMKKGIENISNTDKEELTKAILTSVKNTNAESFKLADLIIDKTQSGLDWRIDATKDIADIDSLKTHKQPFEEIFSDITRFWSKFSKGVLSENNYSYIVAEVTDEDHLHDMAWGYKSDTFPKKEDILPKLFRQTGMTANAQYSKYFYDIVKLFSKSFQDGTTMDSEKENTQYLAGKLQEMLMSSGHPLLKSFSLPSILYAYTFIGNHDKPRALHCAALDMGMFYSDLTYDDRAHREDAYRLLNDKWMDTVTDEDLKNYKFNAVSPKAVAMGMALRKGFVDVLNFYKDRMSPDEFDNNFKAISKAVADLSAGKFKDIRFDADSFGVKPIDFNIEKVIEQAKEEYGFNISDEEASKKFEHDVYWNVMEPAMTKVLAMMKVLAALPGMPTLFDGDDLGATGYDTETKNMYLQGRQRVHNEWMDKDNPKYELISKYKPEFDKVMALRKKPECNALNNGAPFVLPTQIGYNPFGGDKTKYNIPAVLQQSTDGRMTISLFNLHRNIDPDKPRYDNTQKLDTKCLKLSQIMLNFDDNGTTQNGALGFGIQGLANNTEFYNANDPSDIYYVNESNGKYFIKRGTDDGKITINDTTLVLYSNPKKVPLTFRGQYHLEQNPNVIKNAYCPKANDCGKQLSLCQ